MKQITTVVDLLSFIELIKKKNKTIGFIPTMGSLHEGHDSLLRKCQKENKRENFERICRKLKYEQKLEIYFGRKITVYANLAKRVFRIF